MHLRRDEFLTFLKELWRGKSIARIMLNLMLARHVSLEGRVFDLGCGRSPSYWRFIRRDSALQVISVDLNPAAHPTVVASLERPLPFADAQADMVLLLNVLEHIYAHRQLLLEIRRLLKAGGRLYLWVPFLTAIHGDPFDYFRYTASSLANLLEESGFVSIQVLPVGGLFMATGNLLDPLWRWRLLRLMAGGLVLGIETLLPAAYQRQADARWPVGYLVVAA